VLPYFSESPTPIQRFKPGYVYHRRTPASDPSTGLTEVPSHLPVASDPVLRTSYDPPPFRKSSRPHKPPEGMVFQLLWLCLLLCLLFPFPLVINRLKNISAGNKQWRQNFKHLRQIILGTLFLVFHMLSPLVVSGSIL
jgi:hypothetical protein